jgi:hypothetical protein
MTHNVRRFAAARVPVRTISRRFWQRTLHSNAVSKSQLRQTAMRVGPRSKLGRRLKDGFFQIASQSCRPARIESNRSHAPHLSNVNACRFSCDCVVARIIQRSRVSQRLAQYVATRPEPSALLMLCEACARIKQGAHASILRSSCTRVEANKSSRSIVRRF